MCGPKTAACCTVLSTWGLVQLGITGIFMYLGSPALIEDIPLEENSDGISDQVHDIDGQNPVEPKDPEVLEELIQGFDLQKPEHVAALKEMIQNLVNDGI